MKLVPTFAVTQLTPNEVPNMLTTFPLTRYGWLEMGTFLTLRGGKEVAAKSGIYLMIDFPKTSGKWQRAFVKYNGSLDYVDVQRIIELLRMQEPRIFGYEHVAGAADKALWSQVEWHIDLSFGPAMYCDNGPGYATEFGRDAWTNHVLLSPEFPLSENKGVLVMSYVGSDAA